jgi:hypothetical protein
MPEEPSEKDQAKLRKKLAKAEAKQAKKEARAQLAHRANETIRPPATTNPGSDRLHHSTGTSPAERSAAAAERNVVLQQRRFLVGLIAVLVALLSLLVSWWSGQRKDQSPEKDVQKPPAERSSPGGQNP